MDGALRDHQALFEAGPLGGLSDGQLLERFAERREEAVFEAIVCRHGAMVWGVCRRVLRDHHDAEEAFQATFLVLARRAASVLVREKLGHWLYGVACRTARKARATRARRRQREAQVPDLPEPEALPRGDRDGLGEWLDRELCGLPEKYRAPLVLCELEGRSHKEAAGQLGCPVGTVASRLSRGRAMLTSRLARRGVALSAAGLTATLARRPAAAADLPGGLIAPTARAACLFADGGATAGVVPAGVADLTREVHRAMFLLKFKIAAAAVLAGVGVGAGGMGLAYRAQAAGADSRQEARRGPGSGPQKGQAKAPARANAEGPARTPRVASASPDDGAAGVDPATTELRVTYDQDMGRGMSVASSGGGPTDPLDPAARARWTDARLIVVPLKLKPNQEYELSLNTERFRNFTDKGGKPAVPYPIRFRTGDGRTKDSATGAAPAEGPARTPRVASASPDDGAAGVDPATTELRVTYDQDMSHDSMSIVGGGSTFPADPEGKPRWVDARTVVLPLKLKPGQDYELGFNGGRFQNFRNAQGRPAAPYPIHFRTSGPGKGTPVGKGAAVNDAEPVAADPAEAAAPRVARATPDDGAAGVDPATAELRVTFDQDMSPGGFSFVGGGPTGPADPTARPRWVDARTIVLPLKLEPDHDYQLSINNARFQNFRNTEGRPATPYPIRFRTGTGRGEDQGADQTRSRQDNRAAIERLRRAIDEDYSYRDRRDVDWGVAFKSAEDQLATAESPLQFAKRAAALLAPAEDAHLWLKVADWRIPSFERPVTTRTNMSALERAIPGLDRDGPVAAGRLRDGITYLLIASWAGDTSLDSAYEALGRADATRGLVVDVRPNGGGDERLARDFAGCFLDEPRVYSKHVTRHGGAFSPVVERSVGPNYKRPKFRGRVVVLMGPACMSSCESFLLMMKQVPGCTLVGQRSFGSSGNPRPVDLGNGVTAFIPSWRDLRPDGTCLEGEGVAPDVEVEAGLDDLAADPVLEAALAILPGR